MIALMKRMDFCIQFFVPPEPLIRSVRQIVLPISTGTLRPIEWPIRFTRQLWPAMSKMLCRPAFEPDASAMTVGPFPSVAAISWS